MIFLVYRLSPVPRVVVIIYRGIIYTWYIHTFVYIYPAAPLPRVLSNLITERSPHRQVLRIWKSPRALVGGEALKKVLQVEAEKGGAKRGSHGGGGGGGGRRGTPMRGADRFGSGPLEGAAEGAWLADIGDEVPVAISSTTFDRNKKVVERHSQK